MKQFLTCLMAAFTVSVYAQTTDKVVAKVKYDFSHVQDTNNRVQIHTEQMQLAVGKNASLYTSSIKIAQALQLIQMIKADAEQAGGNSVLASVSSTAPASAYGSSKTINLPTLTDYYCFFREQKFYTKEQLIEEYLVVEGIPVINWQISTDTINLSGIRCQKATAYFRGRHWIAWYSEELPFQSGPWKLNGLPGLILEAYDDRMEVQFKFAGIEKINANNPVTSDQGNPQPAGMSSELQNQIRQLNDYLGNEIKLPQNITRTNLKEINKLKTAIEKDPEGFFRAHSGSNGELSDRIEKAVVGIGFLSDTTINNPIEKKEK